MTVKIAFRLFALGVALSPISTALPASAGVTYGREKLKAMTPCAVTSAPFTFCVPVLLGDVNPNQSIKVDCSVSASKGSASLGSGSSLALTTNSAGSYSGSTVVQIKMKSTADPSQAHYYECNFEGTISRSTKPGAQEVLIVEGPIP